MATRNEHTEKILKTNTETNTENTHTNKKIGIRYMSAILVKVLP